MVGSTDSSKVKTANAPGWGFVTERRGNRTATKLTYVDAHPPRFELDPRIRLEIHPDDAKYGLLIEGTLYDEGSGPETIRRTYEHLDVSDGGYVDIAFEYPDRA